MSTKSRPTTRSYNSSRRMQQAAQTRADVVSAAIELFTEQGWSGTTLAAIAGAANASVETIRNGFGSKSGLLRVAMDVAVAGDADDLLMAQRPEFAAIGEGALPDRIQRVAELVVAIHARSAGVWQAVVEAASGDREVDGWRLEMEASRRIDIRRSIEIALGQPPDERLVTLLWLVWGPESYRKLVVDEAMPHEEYRDLIADATSRLIGRPS